MRSIATPRWRALGLALVVAVLASLLVIPSLAGAGDTPSPDDMIRQPEAQEIVPVTLPSRAAASRLGSLGYDLGEEIVETPEGFEVQVIATKSQQDELRGYGYKVGKPVKTEADALALQEEYREMTAAVEAAEEEAEESGDELRVQRAQWFNDPSQGRFLEVEVWSAAGSVSSSVAVNVAFNAGEGTEIGDPGTQSFNLSRFVDVGQYMFHRANSPVLITTANPPTRMRVRSILNGETIGERVVDVKETLTGSYPKGPGAPIGQSDTYEWSFVDKYNDATETYEKIEELAAEFPGLAEVIELPYKSNGYRRKAQALLDPPGNRVVVTAPADVAGEYTYAATTSGPQPPAAGTPSAPFAVANAPDSSTHPGAPASQGCGPFVDFPAGAVALVDRGNCPFVDKTANAQAAGARAVVIVNDVAGAPTPPGGSFTSFSIPTVMISQADGNLLKATVPTAGRLIPGTAIATAQRIGVDSLAWGHEGGNDITIRAVDPGAASSPLSITVTGKDIQISLATSSSGARTSTAKQVVDALNAHPEASQLVYAYTYRNSLGTGIVVPSATHRLSDFLKAPARVSREPFTIKALRIGKTRDGSKVGVLGYSQEHAREWVTPLVALESAERLLRNYDNDDNTKRLVNELDIFIIPTVNPDGTHYSIHDNTLQRRNMTRYCPVTGNYDLIARNTWGVDLNRNFTVGSLADGFSGASSSCTSDTYAGPSELSEPEAKNEVWLTERHPNIKFSMNIHSHGGYFMWAPGAYKASGREPLPRPSYGTERFFYEASSHILNRIKEHRGTNIWDARVGPISDVLYSAAGNSGDEHYYNRGIFAWSFEVGAPRRNATNTSWTDVGFTPPFAEGYEEAMEFSNGLIGMFEVARLYARDVVKPKSELTPGAGTYKPTQKFTFKVSEPADVYYTTNGSRPTLDSTKLAYQGPRQGEATFTLPKGSYTVKWFGVDVRGNVEGGYVPTGKSTNWRQAKVTIK